LTTTTLTPQMMVAATTSTSPQPKPRRTRWARATTSKLTSSSIGNRNVPPPLTEVPQLTYATDLANAGMSLQGPVTGRLSCYGFRTCICWSALRCGKCTFMTTLG
jgi:hypothetical protein